MLPVPEDISRPEYKKQNTDITVYSKERRIHARKIGRLYQSMLVHEQRKHGQNTCNAERSQMEHRHQRD